MDTGGVNGAQEEPHITPLLRTDGQIDGWTDRLTNVGVSLSCLVCFSLPSVTDMSQMHQWICVSGLMRLRQDLLCMQVSQQVGVEPSGGRTGE